MSPRIQVIEVSHVSVAKGRAALRETDWSTAAIPSVSPVLTTRWMAQYKDKFLDPGENAQYLQEILRHVQTLNGVTTQRDIYYALRGQHPDWTYKGKPLGEEFYQHLVLWLMEKGQLMTGMTIQSWGVYPGVRGYVTGDGTIRTPQRGVIPLTGRPAIAFDLADDGMVLSTHAQKVIHFEKEAGLQSLISDNFPKYVEAVFSTSQGQLSEAAFKFLRKAEDRGMRLYAVHDGDPSGLQMQLSYGFASKNNCYMPSEFYPRLVIPLGFYPSIGEALGLPPEEVPESKSRIFGNIEELADAKYRNYPQLRKMDLLREVEVITVQNKMWEFQALSAIHETAPKIYLLEGLRVHGDEIKHVPPPPSIKAATLDSARRTAPEEANRAIEALARTLVESAVPKVVEALHTALASEVAAFEEEVEQALAALDEIDAVWFREWVKRYLVKHPDKYANAVIPSLGRTFLKAEFMPNAKIVWSFTLSDISSLRNVEPRSPGEGVPITSKTDLVSAIEKEIVPAAKTRSRVVELIRTALEDRFGEANDTW